MKPNTEANGLLTPMELYIPDGLPMSNWSSQHTAHALRCLETLSAFFVQPAACPLIFFESSDTPLLPSAAAPLDFVPPVDTKEMNDDLVRHFKDLDYNRNESR